MIQAPLSGIVLHRQNGLGTSRVVDVLTAERGRLRCRAPAAAASRRRFGGGLDVFARLNLVVHPHVRPGALPTLTAVELVEPYLGLRRTLGAVRMAAACCLAVRRLLPEAVAARQVHDALAAALAAAAGGQWVAASLFLPRLATALGTPLSARCSLCGLDGPPLGWLGPGGLACRRCRPGLPAAPPWLWRAVDGEPPADADTAWALVEITGRWLASHHGLSPRALAVSLAPP